MRRIEPGAAAIFFADVLLPLRRAQMRRGSAYLDRGPRRASYWSPIASRTGGIEQLPASQCSFQGALALLEKYWLQHNERDLLQLCAYLDRLHEDMRTPRTDAENAAALPEFVYPLF